MDKFVIKTVRKKPERDNLVTNAPSGENSKISENSSISKVPNNEQEMQNFSVNEPQN